MRVLLDQPQATWASVTVAWYEGATRTVELTSQTAVWYRSGKPPVRIRWVLIRDPQGSFATQALLCTDPSADPTQILEWFVLRWQLEVTFQEVRTHLGVETQPLATRLAGGPVVRSGHRPHHARPAGALLLDHPGRSRVAKTAPHDPAPSGLVRQTIANLRGRHCPGATPTVAGVGEFFTVGGQPRYAGTPSRSVPPNCRCPRLRRLKCGKSSWQESPGRCCRCWGAWILTFRVLCPSGTRSAPLLWSSNGSALAVPWREDVPEGPATPAWMLSWLPRPGLGAGGPICWSGNTARGT